MDGWHFECLDGVELVQPVGVASFCLFQDSRLLGFSANESYKLQIPTWQ